MGRDMLQTHLTLHPLSFVAESDGVMVGCAEAESYAVFPADGADLLRRLVDGMTVSEAADWYQATFGEPVDIPDFVATLHELGFVVIGQGRASSGPVRFQRMGRALFSPAAWGVYAVIAIATIAITTRYPLLRPKPGNVFFVRSLIVTDLMLVFAQIPPVLLHEGFHMLAGRRRGIPSRLGVNRRLYYLVAETHLDGLLGLPRRQRYLPFFAGMLADVTVFGVLTLVATCTMSNGSLPWPGRLALAIAYPVLLRVVWQLFVFLRTDPYFALTTALGCTDLAGASTAYLRRRLGRLGRLTHRDQHPVNASEQKWTPRDQLFAPWFALLSVIGTVSLLALAAVGVVPILTEFARLLASGVAHGTGNAPRFWDSALALVLIVTQLFILPFLGGLLGRRTARRRPKGNPLSAKGTLP